MAVLCDNANVQCEKLMIINHTERQITSFSATSLNYCSFLEVPYPIMDKNNYESNALHHVNSIAMTQISCAHIMCIEYVGSSLGPIYITCTLHKHG